MPAHETKRFIRINSSTGNHVDGIYLRLNNEMMCVRKMNDYGSFGFRSKMVSIYLANEPNKPKRDWNTTQTQGTRRQPQKQQQSNTDQIINRFRREGERASETGRRVCVCICAHCSQAYVVTGSLLESRNQRQYQRVIIVQKININSLSLCFLCWISSLVGPVRVIV